MKCSHTQKLSRLLGHSYSGSVLVTDWFCGWCVVLFLESLENLAESRHFSFLNVKACSFIEESYTQTIYPENLSEVDLCCRSILASLKGVSMFTEVRDRMEHSEGTQTL